MKKISKDEWLKAGMNALGLHGEEAIRIDKMCAELNVSKGSFYHHFQNIENFVVSLMTFWEKENTIDIIDSAEEESSFEEKTEKLNTIVIGKDHLVEVRIRSWAVRDPKVKLFVDKVDGQRIEYLKSLYLQSGASEEKAFNLARLEYAAFIGMQHLFKDLPASEKQDLSQLFQQLLKQS